MLKISVVFITIIITLKVLKTKTEVQSKLCEKWKNETFNTSDIISRRCPCLKNHSVRKCCSSDDEICHEVNETEECVNYFLGVDVPKNITGNKLQQFITTDNLTVIIYEIKANCSNNITDLSFDKEITLLLNNSFDKLINESEQHYCFEFIKSNTPYFKCRLPENNPPQITDPSGNSNRYEENIVRIYLFLMIISMPFLAITSLLHIFISDLFNLVGKCVSSLTFSLLISYSLLTQVRCHKCRDEATNDDELPLITCTSPELFTLHWYFLLSSFFWLNVMCFDIWLVFSGISTPYRNLGKEREIIKYLKYSLYAWGVPAIICMITVISEIVIKGGDGDQSKNTWTYTPSIGIGFWFLNGKISRLIGYYVPLTLILLLNVMFLSFTTTYTFTYTHDKQRIFLKSGGSRVIQAEIERLNLYFRLFLVMGVSWIFEPIGHLIGQRPHSLIWAVLDAMHVIKGILIFIVCVCNRRTMRAINVTFFPSVQLFRSTSGTESNNGLPLQNNKTTSSGTNYKHSDNERPRRSNVSGKREED